MPQPGEGLSASFWINLLPIVMYVILILGGNLALSLLNRWYDAFDRHMVYAEKAYYLSEALLGAVSQLISTVIGKAYAFTISGNPDAAEDLLLWGMRTLEGLKQRENTGHVDQSCGYLYVLLAYVCLKKGKASEAGDAARRALELAKRFDASPNYDARSYRFIDDAENASLHFIMGRTASESMAFFVRLIADKQLTALWERTTENEHEKD
jgi:hypothetical protein